MYNTFSYFPLLSHLLLKVSFCTSFTKIVLHCMFCILYNNFYIAALSATTVAIGTPIDCTIKIMPTKRVSSLVFD